MTNAHADDQRKDEPTPAEARERHRDVAAGPVDEHAEEAEHRALEEHSADTIARLERDVSEAKDQLLRALAEAENVRRRAQKEAADARTYAVTSFARDMLNVADNFRRALEAMPDADTVERSGLKGLVDGIRMTERELASIFERHGVRTVDPMGERFDPNLHQAIFEVPNPEIPSGTVVQVVQQGAVIGDRILRPAMVGVSKGGPKPVPRAPQPEDEAKAGHGEAGAA